MWLHNPSKRNKGNNMAFHKNRFKKLVLFKKKGIIKINRKIKYSRIYGIQIVQMYIYIYIYIHTPSAYRSA